MSRAILLILFLLLSLNIVNAQTFFGEGVSLILLFPLVLIVIIAIAFGVMFIIDTRNFYVSKKAINVPNLGIKATVTEIKEERKEEKKGENEKATETVSRIWINYLDVIDTFAKRLDERDTQEAFSILVKMIKEFFKDRFNLEYEFTYDELLKEFEKNNFHNKELITTLRDLTYKDKKIDKKIIYDLSTKFREAIRIIDREKLEEIESLNIDKNERFNKIRKMVHDLQKSEGKFDDKLNKFIGEEKKRIFSFKRKKEEPKIEAKRDFDNFDRDKLEQISLLIRRGEEYLNKKDIVKLKEVYSDICYLFPFLSDKSKRVAYLEILEFYEEMNIKLFPKLFKELKKD